MRAVRTHLKQKEIEETENEEDTLDNRVAGNQHDGSAGADA